MYLGECGECPKAFSIRKIWSQFPCFDSTIYSYYSLPFKLPGKILQVTLTLLFFLFILYIPTRLFFECCKQKKSFKHKSIGRRCCQLKVLKVLLLMHVFVTLLIDKMTGSDNQLFLCNIHWKMKRRRSF